MVRDYDDELEHRLALRKKYLEDPRYRKWSDVVPGGLGGRQYMLWRDDRLFDYLITNQVSSQSNLPKLKMHLKGGHELPINWSNFYNYFDAQSNDPDNRFIDELIGINFYDPSGNRFTTKKLLDHYRDHLTNTYDMI